MREEDVDFVAAGEGLAHAGRPGRGAANAAARDFAKVPGLWYRDEDEIRANAGRPARRRSRRRDARRGLGPAADGGYRAHNWHCLDGRERQPYAALYTTLGCPYHCSFCCIQAPFRAAKQAGGLREPTNSYRYWSPDDVLEQIDLLVNRYGVRNLKIADEMFVLNRKHVLGICDRIIERGYDLNIWAYTRVDTIKDGMLDRLKAGGLQLAGAWHRGRSRARARRRRQGFDQEEVFEVVGKVRDAGINVIGNYIFGLPEDDADTMQATLDLALDLNCEFANFYSAMAYPGSPLYARALRQGVPLPRSWTGYAQHARDCLPLPTRHLTAREVLQFRDEAFLRYYTGPNYLEMIGRRFGGVAAEHVRRMTNVRLERRLAR